MNLPCRTHEIMVMSSSLVLFSHLCEEKPSPREEGSRWKTHCFGHNWRSSGSKELLGVLCGNKAGTVLWQSLPGPVRSETGVSSSSSAKISAFWWNTLHPSSDIFMKKLRPWGAGKSWADALGDMQLETHCRERACWGDTTEERLEIQPCEETASRKGVPFRDYSHGWSTPLQKKKKKFID